VLTANGISEAIETTNRKGKSKAIRLYLFNCIEKFCFIIFFIFLSLHEKRSNLAIAGKTNKSRL
jgi:hypothetical protein